MTFSETQVSKETLIKRLNGKLRWALWGLVVLSALSAIGAGIWWRRSELAEDRTKKQQDQLLRAIYVMDSTFRAEFATKEDLRTVAEQAHPERRFTLPEESEPELPPDTAFYRERIQLPKEKNEWKK